MGEVRYPKPALYFASVIYRNYGFYVQSLHKLTELLGEIEETTDELDFTHTQYYNEEMGENLKRRFVLFKPLRGREELPQVKIKTNAIERDLSYENKRTVNVDPGYITLENVILATTKNYTHRIYLRDGIYADLTLIYKKGSYRPLEWTYPDYSEEKTVALFNAWRAILKKKLKLESKW
ncbi:MAG: DUF4416 family protein [Desulfobacterota bacterium]|nr:DUF4416 family protein [Thermodesulfobacteriota bacterium]MDW8001142.1 DUF4416 family protein [Deltaproteobacteria bacterium]